MPATRATSEVDCTRDDHRPTRRSHRITRELHVAIESALRKVLYQGRNANRKKEFS
jgi:hypothetical protein